MSYVVTHGARRELRRNAFLFGFALRPAKALKRRELAKTTLQIILVVRQARRFRAGPLRAQPQAPAAFRNLRRGQGANPLKCLESRKKTPRIFLRQRQSRFLPRVSGVIAHSQQVGLFVMAPSMAPAGKAMRRQGSLVFLMAALDPGLLQSAPVFPSHFGDSGRRQTNELGERRIGPRARQRGDEAGTPVSPRQSLGSGRRPGAPHPPDPASAARQAVTRHASSANLSNSRASGAGHHENAAPSFRSRGAGGAHRARHLTHSANLRDGLGSDGTA
jgi:hypothetical protein